MRKMLIALLVATLAVPATVLAAPTVEELQQQIQALQEQLNAIASQVKESEAAPAPAAEIEEDVEDLMARVDKVERKTALDRINWYGDLRNKFDSLHYQDVTWNPGINVNYTDFFNKVGAALDPTVDHPLGDMNVFVPDGTSPLGFSFDPSASGGTALDQMFVNLSKGNPVLFSELMGKMGNYMLAGVAPGVGPYPMLPGGVIVKPKDINNDIAYTTRLRLGMKADVWDNVSFSGRLLMYKNWGDSTGTKVFDSWNSFTMDGTSSGNTSGDLVRVERAYFDWRDIADTPFYLSIGRRPSTYGPPSQYRENEQRGGTPSGHLVHFNFDGITAGYHLSKHTGIEGQTIRFCYGQGFESEIGNGELFNEIETKDVHLGGFNIDLINDGTNFLQMTLFRAMDVTDGFKGTIAFPTQFGPLFAPTMNADMQKFPNFNFVTRVQPSTTIGDINLAGLGFAREEMNGINWFGSFGWTQARPNGKTGMFGGLLSDAVWVAELNDAGDTVIMRADHADSDENRDGYSAYVGVQIPAPMGKFGLEYNYGSKYWTPFTQAQDDLIGSKLATRGHVGEAYYIIDVNPKMFIKLAGLYYDYEYTGSGSPVGKPQKIDDVLDGKAFSMLPAVDTAWNVNAALTVKF